MFCSECGTKVQGDNKFCSGCGAKIIKEQEEATESYKSQVAADPIINKKKYIPLILASILAIAIIVIAVAFIKNNIIKKSNQKDANNIITETADMNNTQDDEDAKSDKDTEDSKYKEDGKEEQTLSFTQDNIEVTLNAEMNLNDYLTIKGVNKDSLKWTCESSAVRMENGIVTISENNIKALVTLTSTDNNDIKATCRVFTVSEGEEFAKQISFLNGSSAHLASIDVFKDNYKAAARNTNYLWNEKLFYTLEEISPDSYSDGMINGYDIEKKQLMNAVSKNKMEYEIYKSPSTDKINKIVSIEYMEDYLEITDYYYTDDGLINFIFVRNDINYIPTYANPSIDGERFYYNEDVLVKWRVVKEQKQSNYIVGKKEKDRASNGGTSKLYSALSDKKKKAFDKKENKMINAAYNTYNVVLASEGISNIIGYINNDSGEPMSDATIKLYSEDFDNQVYECTTNEDGLYAIVVPSVNRAYRIEVTKTGYVSTDLYGIDLNRHLIGVYQENIPLVKNGTGNKYNIRLALFDAFNYAMDRDGMLRLDYAKANIRKGINNRYGDIYLASISDEYGEVIFNLEPGTYTVEVVKDGYEVTYYTITSKKDNDYVQINTTPVLYGDEVRIVLTWDSDPRDLDSHLFTPYDSSSGDNTYHIWYGNQSDYNYNNLDVDEVNGYGPETMTINSIDNGLYKYYVADFTNCSGGNHTSKDMSYSNACVRVYTKDGLVQSFYVPNNRKGVIWEVFEIRNKTIIPIQRYYSNIDGKTWWNSEK